MITEVVQVLTSRSVSGSRSINFDESRSGLRFVQPDEVMSDLRSQLVPLLRRRFYRDLARVVNIATTAGLDESFLDFLPPELHSAFLKCLDEIRREELFDAING